jgi:hypothetical protein
MWPSQSPLLASTPRVVDEEAPAVQAENHKDACLPPYVNGLFVAQARLDSAARILHAGVAANRGGPVKHRQLLRLRRGVLPRSSVPLCSWLSAGVVSFDRAFAAARLARR